MAALPENVSDDFKLAIDELESAVADIESRLESTRAERDEAKARQVELEIENANLRRELEPLARAPERQRRNFACHCQPVGQCRSASASDRRDHAGVSSAPPA